MIMFSYKRNIISSKVKARNSVNHPIFIYHSFLILNNYPFLIEAGATAVFGPGTKISDAAIQILEILIG